MRVQHAFKPDIRHSCRVLVIASPGQGAQTPGFLTPWLEDPAAAAALAAYSEAAALDLVHFGTEADTESIRDTAVAQPLLVAAGLITGRALLQDALASDFPGPDLWVGHSVGELTAAGLAGVLTSSEAVALVAERGRAMADASAQTPTGMTAVLGGDRDEVLSALAAQGLTPANDNGPGQIVAAGTLKQLAALADNPPAKARLIPLSVAGAFHTLHMAPAIDRLALAAAQISPADTVIPLVSNQDGAVVSDGAEVLRRIIGQVANPVRWDLCMDTLVARGITGLLEVSPAGTLTGIARRALKGVATFALKTPDQLTEARAFCAEHAEGRSDA